MGMGVAVTVTSYHLQSGHGDLSSTTRVSGVVLISIVGISPAGGVMDSESRSGISGISGFRMRTYARVFGTTVRLPPPEVTAGDSRILLNARSSLKPDGAAKLTGFDGTTKYRLVCGTYSRGNLYLYTPALYVIAFKLSIMISHLCYQETAAGGSYDPRKAGRKFCPIFCTQNIFVLLVQLFVDSRCLRVPIAPMSP